jgi:hypothetical protein
VADVLTAFQNTGASINDPSSDQEGPLAIYRRIDVEAARLALGGTPSGAPGAPGTPTIGGSGNNVTISWTAPTTGGAPTSYTLIARFTCGGAVITSAPVGNALSFSTPAPNGTYCVSVRAANAAGNGPESAGTSFNVPIVGPPPGAPTNLTATTVGQTLTLSWGSPTTGGPPSGYVATVSGTISGVFPLGLTNTVTAGGLPGGTYSISVAATNSAGTGPSSNTVTFVIGASAPTMNPPSVSGGNVTFSWVNGSGGSTPTGFVLRARLAPGGPIVASLTVSGNSFTVPGVPRGTYFVSVQAMAGALLSAESNQVTVVVP